MEKKLVLFDIDGTLIYSGKGARKSLKKAIMKHTGKVINPTYENTAGRTDRWIIRNLLNEAGASEDFIDEKINVIIEDYIQFLRIEYNKDNDAVIFEGVRELLKVLNNMNGSVYLGLITGNVEEGARIKLSPFNINKYFPFGAFGSDAVNRDDLPGIALNKARELYGITFEGKNIIIIGDTVFDVACGKKHNAKTIAVVRKNEKIEEVKRTNPDYFFTGFQETEKVIESILS